MFSWSCCGANWGHFKSPTGYVVVAAVLLLLGFSLVDVVRLLNRDATIATGDGVFYRSFYFWQIVLLTSPLITMRAFAAEKSSGTYQALMTTPVGDWQVVLAKFSAALDVLSAYWAALDAHVVGASTGYG